PSVPVLDQSSIKYTGVCDERNEQCFRCEVGRRASSVERAGQGGNRQRRDLAEGRAEACGATGESRNRQRRDLAEGRIETHREDAARLMRPRRRRCISGRERLGLPAAYDEGRKERR